MASDGGKTVSFPYLRNHLGLTVDEESMKAVPHAKGELYFHVVLKAGQLGAFLGMAAGAGAALLRRQKPYHYISTGARYGMLGFLPLGVLMTYSKMRSVSQQPDADLDYAYYDRSYRLRHNCMSIGMDRTSAIGLLAGAATAASRGGSALSGGAVGVGVGFVSGIALHVARNQNNK